jgi:hypothetical protein
VAARSQLSHTLAALHFVPGQYLLLHPASLPRLVSPQQSRLTHASCVRSRQADIEREAKGEKHKHMVEAQDVIKRFFQRMIVDRSALSVSKKLGCLFLIVHLFKIYFKVSPCVVGLTPALTFLLTVCLWCADQ